MGEQGTSTDDKDADRKRKRAEDDDGDDNDEGEDLNVDEEDDEDEDDDADQTSGTLNGFEYWYDRRKGHQQPALVSDSAVVDDVVGIIRHLLKSGQDEVSFALQYLYRRSSMLPEYLKGSDSLLYQTLSKDFDVSLHAIVLHETTDYQGKFGTEYSKFRAYKFDHEELTSEEERSRYEDVEDDIDEAEEGKKPRAALYVSCSSALEQLSKVDYVEYTGNEAILGDGKYFGGAMFVKPKGQSQEA